MVVKRLLVSHLHLHGLCNTTIWFYFQDCTYFTRKEILRWATFILNTARPHHVWVSVCVCVTHLRGWILLCSAQYYTVTLNYSIRRPVLLWGFDGHHMTSNFIPLENTERTRLLCNLFNVCSVDQLQSQLCSFSFFTTSYHRRYNSVCPTFPCPRLFYRYRDLAPQLVPLDYTNQPDVKLPYELIGSMPELKVDPLVDANPAEPLLPAFTSIINVQLIDIILWKVMCYLTPLNLEGARGSLGAHLLGRGQCCAPLQDDSEVNRCNWSLTWPE